MADLNFPQDPYVGQTYSIGTRTWQWNGSGWALQSGILSTNPFRVVSIEVTTTTNSTSTNSGAIIVAGGGGFGGDIYAANIFSNGSAIVTTATIGNFGVSAITAGTDTAIYIGGGNNYTIWNTSTLQSVTDRGATTNNAISITNGTASSASNTGSLTLSAGAGIAGNLYVGGGTLGLDNGVSNTIAFSSVGTGAPTFTTRSAGTKLLLYPTLSGSATDYAIGINAGVLWNSLPAFDTGQYFKWYGGTTEIANLSGQGAFSANSLYDNSNRVLTNVLPAAGTAISITGVSTSNTVLSFTINNEGVISLAGTTYLGISAVSGAVTLSNLGVQTLTAGTDTAVSASTGTITVWSTSTLQSITNRGAETSNAIRITNATGSSTSTGGALTVTGGVGIGQNLNIGGTLNVWGNTTFSSPVIFNGTATYVYSTNTYYTDNLIELHTTSTGVNTEWSFDDGKDIGLRFHYYNRSLSSGTNAALVLANDSQLLEFYSAGAEASSGTFAGSVYGGFKTGFLKLTGDNAVASSVSVSQQTITVSANGLGVNGASYFANNLGVGGTATLSSAGVTNNFTVTGATTLGGAVTANSSLGVVGAVNVTGTTTLASLGVIGAVHVTGTTTLSGPLNVTNGTSSAGTNTGAVIVAGGLGVGENVNVGGNLYVAGVINATVVGSISTATNITGGSSGSIPYQTAFGRTSFFGPGTAGDLLVSNGGGSPSFVNTLTLAGTTEATNTTSGALQVKGGVGIGGNLYAGGNAYVSGTTTATNAYISSNLTASAITGTNIEAGGVGFGSVYLTQYASVFAEGGASTANVLLQASANNLTGGGIGIATLSGGQSLYSSGGIDFTTNRTLRDRDTPQGGNTFMSLSTSGVLTLSGNVGTTATTNGTLVVTGGVGISGGLNVGGNARLLGTATTISNAIITSLTVEGSGTALTVSTNASVIGILTATTLSVTSATIPTINENTYFANNIGVEGTLNVTGTTTLSVVTATTAQVTGNLTVVGTSTLANPVLIGPVAQYISFVSDLTSTNATITLDSFAITDYQTAKYLVQIEDRGFTPKKIHVEEMVLFHDDNGPSTLVYLNSYAISSNLGELGTFDVNYVAGQITLTFTPNYTPTQLLVKTVRTAIMS